MMAVHEQAQRDHHDERAIAFFGTWMVSGLYLDGWAHNVEKPETFFSPWHLILYSGFGAAVAYFSFRGVFLRKRSDPDKLTTAGLVLFVVSAIGDGIWHEVFGIEVNIEALLSPTHVGLMVGGLLMLGIGYRSAIAAREERVDIGVVITTTLCAAVIMFFTQYNNAFRFRGLFTDQGVDPDGGFVFIITSVFFVNVVLVSLVFLLVRTWRTPRWTFTFSFALLAALQVGLNGFFDGARTNILFAALAGAGTDILVRRFDPKVSVRNARILSVVVPLVIWGLWLIGLLTQFGVRVPAEIWTGMMIFCVLQGVGIGLLAVPSRQALPTAPNRSSPDVVRHAESAT